MARERHRQLKNLGRQRLAAKKLASGFSRSTATAERSEETQPECVEPVSNVAIEQVDALEDMVAEAIEHSNNNSESALESATESVVVQVEPAISEESHSSRDEFVPDPTSHQAKWMEWGAKVWSDTIEQKVNELVGLAKSFEHERIEIETLRQQLKQAIEAAENRIHESDSQAGKDRIAELEIQLAEAIRENEKLATLLLNTRSEYQDLVDFIESEVGEVGEEDDDSNEASINDSDCDAMSDAEAEQWLEEEIAKARSETENEFKAEISQLHEQIQFLQQELTESRSQPLSVTGDEAELRIQIEKLRAQLLEARHEAVETRLQNNELSSTLAKLKGPSEGQKFEAMSWEQRKEALLRQLEAETQSEDPCDPRKILEIENVIKQTDEEIIRRDREIADLRALLEQQAVAQNGMAIGVAAVAEMIESDAMIVAERMRLQEMQKEWEQKQRQAEIEMSLERAKLARERLELQEKLQAFESTHPPQTDEERKVAKEKSRGRWLARLGLREE